VALTEAQRTGSPGNVSTCAWTSRAWRWDRRDQRSLRTAMKEGLLGGKLCLSSRTYLEEARLHVARWA
jgi:hypothetical protein